MDTQKSEQQPADRRQDYERRLRVAVRKAHDPLFNLLKTPPEEPRGKPSQR